MVLAEGGPERRARAWQTAAVGNAKRVAMLAPMQIELQPIVQQLSLTDDGDGDGTQYRGHAGDVEVVALLTNIGLRAGAEAATRALNLGVDWLMVVGVAGGVDHANIRIGDVVVPEIVHDRATRTDFRPTPVGDVAPRGIISCGDELICDPVRIAEFEANGVVAVEMESSAVALVAEAAGVPWSVFRCISDFADGGLVDDAIFAMTKPDGSADPDAMKRYLEENPERLKVLEQLATDTTLATSNAAAAAIRACALLP
jgi:nucleoside phosphorylase